MAYMIKICESHIEETTFNRFKVSGQSVVHVSGIATGARQ